MSHNNDICGEIPGPDQIDEGSTNLDIPGEIDAGFDSHKFYVWMLSTMAIGCRHYQGHVLDGDPHHIQGILDHQEFNFNWH